MRTSEIMLDRNFNAKLPVLVITQSSPTTDNGPGTRSYIDPAYVDTGRIFPQAAYIYSLGVMLLEIVCGEKPILLADMKNHLVEKVQKCQEKTAILDAADTSLRGQFDEEIKRALEIGLMCVRSDRDKRPQIRELRNCLKQLVTGRAGPEIFETEIWGP